MTAGVQDGGPLPGALVAGIAVLSLGLSAFFSGSETGLMSVSRSRLRRLHQLGHRRAKPLEKLLGRIEEPIMTCLIGNNLVNVLISAVVTADLSARMGAQGQWVAVGVVSISLILVGEILPKVLFREFPERLTLAAVRPLLLADRIFMPVRRLLVLYAGLWRLLLRRRNQRAGLDRRGLAALLLTYSVPDHHEEHFAQVMHRFLELAGLPLRGVMRPLAQLVTVRPDVTVQECLDLAAQSGFSRLPVATEDGRGLQGYVLVRDLLFLPPHERDRQVDPRLWRSLLLVDVRVSAYELFEELRSQGRQLAVLVDEAGNPLGMITLEDLIETVMGSISDEFDADPRLHGGLSGREKEEA